MAIINTKAANEADRDAQEYARRHDTASSIGWQQPPPAYEEAATSQSNSRASRISASTEIADLRGQEEQASAAAQHTANAALSDDESTPLLSRRQWEQLSRKKRRSIRLRKSLRFFFASMTLTCFTIMSLQFLGYFHNDQKSILPIPPSSDGQIGAEAKWSAPFRLDHHFWPDVHTPLMSSKANFTFSAFDNLFLRASESGSGFGGEVIVSDSSYLSEKDWKAAIGGDMDDTVLIQVEARYTDVRTRDRARVIQMCKDSNTSGLGIYGSAGHHKSMVFYVYIMLPAQSRRSLPGLHTDGSSFIPALDLKMDNMRLAIESLHSKPRISDSENGITLGKLQISILNAGIELTNGIKANQSVSISLQNGYIRESSFTDVYSISAPQIDISIIDGPIVLSKLVALDMIALKSIYGLINITSVAIAPSIEIRHEAGATGGIFRANKLDIKSAANEVDVTVDLRENLFDGEDNGMENPGNLQCQKRTVEIRTADGDIAVRYDQHSPIVNLDSIIKTKTGKVSITHDSGFEGSFRGHTHLGPIEVHRPRPFGWFSTSAEAVKVQQSRGRSFWRKYFIISNDNRASPGDNSIEGRMWWNNHDDSIESYCHSQSNASSHSGRMQLYF